jgi:hypothetical protein
VSFGLIATNVSQLIKVADLEVLNFNLALNTPFLQTAVAHCFY